VPFSLENGDLHLTREGGRSQRRIVHAADATGSRAAHPDRDSAAHSGHHAVRGAHAVDLIVGRKLGLSDAGSLGLHALDAATDEVVTFRAPHTVLATGGAGKVYLYTTNPDTATGDGIAAA
jgi:L-aspartate oxidase